MIMRSMLCVAAVLLAISQTVNAADYTVQICSAQTSTGNNNALIRPCETWTSKNSCSNGSWVAWNMSEGNGRAMYSAALTALSTGQNVTLRVDGSSCIGLYDETKMIRITKN